jgi:hypothetical protein
MVAERELPDVELDPPDEALVLPLEPHAVRPNASAPTRAPVLTAFIRNL